MTKNRGFRVTIFKKILGSCLALSTLIIGGWYAYTAIKLAREAKGPYLVKHFKRYVNYQHGLGEAVVSVASALASDPDLADDIARA